MMNILIITPTLNSNSGWGRYSYNVLSEYKKRDVKFIVSTLKSSPVMDEQRPIILPFSFINLFKNIFKLRKLSKTSEIVHALDGWPYAVYGFFTVLGTNKDLYINGVGTYSLPGRSITKKVLMKLAYKRSKNIFCISHYTKKLIDEFYPSDKTVVVYLGVTPMPVLSDKDLEEMEEKFQLKNFGPVFITVGAIKKRKGQQDSLSALTYFKKEYPNFIYIMVGSDEDSKYISKIKSIAKDNDLTQNIRIISDVKSDRELSFLYQKSDILLLNSRNYGSHFEGFGLVFLEAYQFGVLGVGSNNCGVEDAIQDGVTGYLTNQGDTKDIVLKIRTALMNKNTLKGNSLKFVKNFSWSKTADSYLKFYKDNKLNISSH